MSSLVGYTLVRDGRVTLAGGVAQPIAQPLDARFDLGKPLPQVTRAGWYRWRANTPFDPTFMTTAWHCCQKCAREGVGKDTRLRPTDVAEHLATEHNADLDQYVIQYYETGPDFDSTIAVWREP